MKKIYKGKIVKVEPLKTSKAGNSYFSFLLQMSKGVADCICFNHIADEASKLIKYGLEIELAGDFSGGKITVSYFNILDKEVSKGNTDYLIKNHGSVSKYRSELMEYITKEAERVGAVVVRLDDGSYSFVSPEDAVFVNGEYRRKVDYVTSLYDDKFLFKKIREAGFGISTRIKFKTRWNKFLDDLIKEKIPTEKTMSMEVF